MNTQKPSSHVGIDLSSGRDCSVETYWQDGKMISHRKVGNTDYVTHRVKSIPEARTIADAICEQSILPVYFGTGYAISHPHIQRVDYGCELVLRFFPAGETRAADDYTCVHSFVVTP